jgi:hypothetical protein
MTDQPPGSPVAHDPQSGDGTQFGQYRLIELMSSRMFFFHRGLDGLRVGARVVSVVSHNLPVQLTSFVGGGAQMTDVEKLLADNRLVTLTILRLAGALNGCHL